METKSELNKSVHEIFAVFNKTNVRVSGERPCPVRILTEVATPVELLVLRPTEMYFNVSVSKHLIYFEFLNCLKPDDTMPFFATLL